MNIPIGPATAAGKRLLAVMSSVPPDGRKGLAHFVAAIEAEAVDAEQRRIAAVVRDLPLHGGWHRCDDVPRFVERAAVLAIVEPDRPVVVLT